MIRLSKIYSNKKQEFPDIEFKDGLNVIFASVSKDSDKKSSHSLGKTTLIDVLDFCFLKQISKEHFLKKDCFSDFEFFLEIQCDPNRFITIKRPVSGKISITSSNECVRFQTSNTSDWDYKDLALKKAKEHLNRLICPKQVLESGFNYRNGLRYCFRKQTQYEDTFKVNNSRESDASWAPYLASIIGINYREVEEKYELNKRVESLKNAINEVKNLPSNSSQSLEAEITQIEAAVSRMKIELDKFDFTKADENVSKELIHDVSENVSSMVSTIYSLDQKISAIDKSLQTEFTFEMDKVLSLFEEVQIYFPENLTKSYEDLIRINQDMSIGRKDRLVTTKRSILSERDEVSKKLSIERVKQQELTAVLLQKDAFDKYKKLQSRLTIEESRVAVLKERLVKIDLATELGDKLELAENEKSKSAKKLEIATRVRGNEKLTRAVTLFSELVDHILNFAAFFYTDTNKDGNIQFKIGLRDQTSINEGFSYTRVLSAIFDATLLVLHSEEDFFRFSYHDGLLESLDDRLKFMLIDEWRRVSIKHNLQFIITVLDSDLPLKDTKKAYFEESEIIRELHDRGADGRLFRMASF